MHLFPRVQFTAVASLTLLALWSNSANLKFQQIDLVYLPKTGPKTPALRCLIKERKNCNFNFRNIAFCSSIPITLHLCITF